MPRQPTLALLVRQHAQTSRYLGVDFVPVYRSTRHAIDVTFEESAAADESTSSERLNSLNDQPAPASQTPVPAGQNAVEPAMSGGFAAPSSGTSASIYASNPALPSTAAPRRLGSEHSAAPSPKPDSLQMPRSTPAPKPAARTNLPKPPASRAATPPNAGFVTQPPQPDWDQQQVANWELLEAIRKRYEEDAPHQHFVTDHHCIVFGDGDPCARLVFVGEAPGAEEDKVGKPFVGRAGDLLNKMITAMGLSRARVYITNVLKTRPPNNATPTLDEARLCSPYLFDQIAVIKPEVIVTLGLPATRLLLNTDQTMGALRGKWAEFRHGPVSVPVMPTYHPAFLLRSYTTENREKVWSDLQKAMERLGMRSTKSMPQ